MLAFGEDIFPASLEPSGWRGSFLELSDTWRLHCGDKIGRQRKSISRRPVSRLAGFHCLQVERSSRCRNQGPEQDDDTGAGRRRSPAIYVPPSCARGMHPPSPFNAQTAERFVVARLRCRCDAFFGHAGIQARYYYGLTRLSHILAQGCLG